MRNGKVTTLLLAASLALPLGARAQQTAIATPNPAPTTRTFALKNISKERMLFWLHPPDAEKSAISLPVGVTELKTDDATNALIARGSADGLEQIQTIIEFLDKPLQVVELDVHVVVARRGEWQKLQKVAEPQVIESIVAFSYQMQTRDALDDLMLSPDAQVLAGKILTFNNLSATVLLQKIETADIKPARGTAPLPPTQIVLTPTVSRDGTINVSTQVANGENFQLSTSANVKNDGTICIVAPSDGKGKFANALEAAGAPRDAEIVIAITPHILKKAMSEQEK